MVVKSSRDLKTTNIMLCSPERGQEKGGASSGKIIHASDQYLMLKISREKHRGLTVLNGGCGH